MPNAYASKICAGKIKDPSGVKRKDFRGPKPSKAMGGGLMRTGYMGGGMARPMYGSGGSVAKGCGKVMSNRRKKTKVY